LSPSHTRILAVTFAALIALSPVAAARQTKSLLLTPDAPEFTRPAPARSTVTFETSKGDIVMEIVAFAFAVPNGRTTQMFINLQDNSATHDKEPFVDLGRVISGMDVADKLTTEYGEGPGGIRAGKQDDYFAGGNAWLLQKYPNLDYIKKATVK
jgi:hypothetical protein